MSASNWVSSREISPDRDNRYRVDNMALQLRLGLPIELIGISGGDDILNFPGQRNKWQGNFNLKESNSSEIKQTVDGIPIRKVYITNISLEVERREITTIFGPFGQIMNIYLGVSKNTPNKKFAFVTFADPKSAARVLNMHKFQDSRRRYIYAVAADSWHQPKENANGEIIWNYKMKTKQEEENEENDQLQPVEENFETLEITEESLNILNDDCLLHIFSFLSLQEVARIEMVCKRWQGLSYRMWRCLHKLSFSEPTLPKMKANTSTLAAYLQRCGPSLRELDLSIDEHDFDETTLAVVAKYCNNLEILRVNNLAAGNRSLAHLGRSCPNLKQLFMNECAKFNDKDLMSFLPKCHQLSVLDISNSSGITGSFLAKVQSPLVTLQLNNLPTFNASALIAGLQRMSGTLETLVLNSCGNLHCGEVEKLVSAVPNLTSFSLCRILSSLQFYSDPLVPISKLKKLNSINLSRNLSVNDKLLFAIVDGCEDLTEINLSSSGCNGLLTEQGLTMLSRLRRLKHLDISYLENTTDVVLKGITSRNSRLQKLICRGCPELSDEGCIQVVTVCNDLELFDVSGCCPVSEQTVCAALTSVKMRTNNVPLRLIVGGTEVKTEVVSDPDVPLLTVDLNDLSEEYLRPDFIDDMFFPPSDSDEEEDIDHLCEQMGCDCDFDFDDLYDPTLFLDGLVDDAPPVQYEHGDEEPVDLCWVQWLARTNDDENDESDIWFD